MKAGPHDRVHEILSVPRYTRYVQRVGGDAGLALGLYQWNLELAAAFYPLLHWVEVGLRNAMHRQLQRHFERADWWAAAALDANGRNKVNRARAQLKRRKGDLGTPDDLVTELSFGFWVSLLSRGRAYDRTLWVPALHRAFPHYSGPRRDLHAELYALLHFRNRVMHYEPVFELDLAAYRDTIYRALGYFSQHIVELVIDRDRILDALERAPQA